MAWHPPIIENNVPTGGQWREKHRTVRRGYSWVSNRTIPPTRMGGPDLAIEISMEWVPSAAEISCSHWGIFTPEGTEH